MKKIINRIKQTFNKPAKAPVTCNYGDNYYGDQMCG